MAYLKMYGGNIQIGKTIDIYSAAVDTIYYMKNGVAVTVGTTDATGKLTVNKSYLRNGTYTLYSSVAKDLPNNNTTNPYHKTVTVTDNTSEIYLMPDRTLYWYGYSTHTWENKEGNNQTYKEPTITNNTNSTIVSVVTNKTSGDTVVGVSHVTYISETFSKFKIFVVDGTLGVYSKSDSLQLCSIINNSYQGSTFIAWESHKENVVVTGTFTGTAGYYGFYMQSYQLNKPVSCTYAAVWLE